MENNVDIFFDIFGSINEKQKLSTISTFVSGYKKVRQSPKNRENFSSLFQKNML